MLNRIVRSVAFVALLAASLLLPPASAMPEERSPAPAQDGPATTRLPEIEPGPSVEPGAREHVDLRDLLRQAEPAEGAQILRDYAREKGIPLDERPPMPDDPDWSIVLSAVTLTPAPGMEPSLQDKLPALQEGEGEVPLILQFNRGLSLGEEIELYELGLKGLAYERPNYARIVLAPGESLPELLEKPYLRWVGEYKAEYKVSPEPSGSGRKTAFIYPIEKGRDRYEAELARMGIQVTHYDDIVGLYSVVLEEERFPEAAELPWVRWIHKAPEEAPEGWQDFEPDDSRELVSAFKESSNGSGVTVGVRDDGIYAAHPDLTGSFATGSESSPVEAHGTHVTGILAGRGTRDIAGAHDATGLAPAAQVLFRSYESDGTDDVTNYSQDLIVFGSNSVQISNHSYWFLNQDYDADTQNYDEYMDNDDMIIVKSAGNQGWEVPNTITNPGTGKNVLAVGAVVYVADANKGREVGDIAGFSSRGPTLENGRLKPELVAPGGQGDYADFRHGVVSCNDDPDGTSTGNEWPEDDQYDRQSGTSMAAPHVAGALALMKENYSSLSSEAAKARLIGGTIPLKNSSGSDPLSGYANTEAGFGLLNAHHAAGYWCSGAYTLHWWEGVVDYADDSDDYTFTVPSGTEQLIAVMAYNDDAPDDTGQICDDVDLSLEYEGGGIYPYSLPTGVTAEGTVEKIIIESPPSDESWTAHVALDNPSPSHSQEYSLYVLVIVELPELGLSASLPHGGYYAPGETFALSTTAENTGDWVVAGVTGQVVGDVGGEVDKTKFYDSLVCNGDSKTVTFDLEAPAEWGPYDFTVTAKGVNRGLADDSVPLSIVVCDTSNSPGLVQPPNGNTTCDTTPTFDWDSMAGAASYRIQVAEDSSFISPVINTTTTGPQYTPGSPLPVGTYYWRVRGEAPSCQGLWSAVWSFTVKTAPTAPSLHYPDDGSETCDTTPYLMWNWMSGATSYQIQVDGSPGFTSPEVDDTISSTAYTVGSALSPDTYYWRVRAHNSCGWGPWSLVWSFTIPDTANPPELLAPEHGSETCDTTPTFDWSDIPGASLYVIQVDNNSDLGSPEIEASAPNSQYTAWPPLAKDRYYWRVRTYSSCGYGIWSDVHHFDVIDTPTVPTHVLPADGSEQCNTWLVLQWHPEEWASSYRVQVSASLSFGSLEVDANTDKTWYSPDPPLPPGTYYWRVWADSACGGSGWSSPWSFILVEMPVRPTLQEPVGSVICDTMPTFWWSVPTMGISQYRLQVNDIPDFDSPDRDVTTPDGYYTLGAPLDSPKTWYWRVNAQNACGTGPWSSHESFRLTTVAPSTPSLATPADGSEVCDTTPTFDWSSVSWTSSYQIEVDDDPGFGSPEVDLNTSDSEYTPGTALSPGTYHWRVQACNDCGCSTWTSAWDLTVKSTPDAPFHTSPSDGSTTGDSTPSLTWHYVVDAVEYRIQIDDDAGFGSPDPDQTTANTTFSPGSPLANGTYYWRVQASNSVCWGPWSDAWQLTVDANCGTVPKPDLISPPVGAETCDTTPTFEWSIVSGASHYQLQVDDNLHFPTPIVDTTTTGTSYTMETELDYRSYYWWVRGCNACGCGSWSSLQSFEVKRPPWYIGPFPLLTPPDGSSTCDLTPTFDWVAIGDTTHYEIEVDNDAGFTSPEIDAAPSASTHTPGSDLSPDSYDWHVRPCNDCGCGEWSQVWSVDVLSTPAVPSLTSPADGSITGDDMPSFGWGSVFGGTTYAIQVDDDPAFGSAEIDDTTADTSYTAASPLPDATYHWRVQAANACDTGAWSSPWQLTVDSTCLIAISPILSFPAHGTSTCDATPAFAWSAVGGATSYQIQVDDSGSGFPSPLIDTTTSSPDYTPGTALLPDTYHWRTRACNECGCGPWSSAWNVTITAIPGVVPLLTAPATGSTTCDPAPDFDWLAIGDATSYEIQIDDSPTFSTPIIEATVLSSLYTPGSPLPAGAYYWQVRACNDCGCGAWSATWNVTIGPPASAPSLASPPDGHSTCETMPTFAWSPVGGTELYELEVDGDPGFPSPLIDIDAPDPLFTPGSPLPPGTFYWRVQAHNACGSSGWSGYWSLNRADCAYIYLPVVIRETP